MRFVAFEDAAQHMRGSGHCRFRSGKIMIGSIGVVFAAAKNVHDTQLPDEVILVILAVLFCVSAIFIGIIFSGAKKK